MAKILLVEDNPDNLDMLTRRLVRKGYEVVTATDGAEAVTQSATEMPDIILMDMSLPVLDGWAATAQIKAQEKTSAIPIIALTAHAMSSDRARALAAGCTEFETKPIEFPRLIGKIEALLGSAKGAS